MKEHLLYIALLLMDYTAAAQKLTTPEVIGTETGTQLTVRFPFELVGKPFAQIPGSVWNSYSYVVVQIYMSYYVEGDAKKYSNMRSKRVNVGKDGSWKITDLSIDPVPFHIKGKKLVDSKTFYSIFVHQEQAGKKSNSWNAEINRRDRIIDVQKIQNQNLGKKIGSIGN